MKSKDIAEGKPGPQAYRTRDEVKQKAQAGRSGLAPLSAAVEAAVQQGDQQILALPPGYLETLWLMTSRDVYRVNVALRNGVGFNDESSMMTQMASYPTIAAFVMGVRKVMDRVGPSLALPGPVVVHRGVRYRGEINGTPLTYDDLVGRLLSGDLDGKVFTDESIGFAHFNGADARTFSQPERPGDIPIAFELEVDRALVSPPIERRSDALIDHLVFCSALYGTWGQFIFEPSTQWKLVSAELVGEDRLLTVRMRQISQRASTDDDDGASTAVVKKYPAGRCAVLWRRLRRVK